MTEPDSTAKPVFAAFLWTRRRRWPLWAALGALAAGAMLVAARHDGSLRVPTPKGFRVIKRGMGRGEAQAALGGPLMTEANPDGTQCFVYGHPTFKQPVFTLYRACYQDEKLTEIAEKRYTASQIDPKLLKSP